MDAQTTTLMLCCTACGARTEAQCGCNATYEPLSPTEQTTRRQKKAADLYQSGLTMQQIADKLKVGRTTVSVDLSNMAESAKSKRPKSAINPKGAGRPAGRKTKPPGIKQAQRSIDLLPEVWEQVKARAAAGNMAVAEFIGQLLTVTIDPTIDPKTLSKSGQDKLAAAIRQHRKVLEREFEPRVQAEYTARVKKNFPDLDKMQRDARDEKSLYERLRRETKTPMTTDEFNLVRSLLHPDSRASASEERLLRGFQMFDSKQFALTGVQRNAQSTNRNR